MSTHNICFHGEIRKICGYPSYLELRYLAGCHYNQADTYIFPEEALFQQKYWYFSYFSTRTCVVILIRSAMLEHF